MVRWTYTEGPRRGRSYEGSARAPAGGAGGAGPAEEAAEPAARALRAAVGRGQHWGAVSSLRVRRDPLSPGASVADFELDVHGEGRLLELYEGVPVVFPDRESGLPCGVCSDVKEGGFVQAKIVSSSTAVWKSLSEGGFQRLQRAGEKQRRLEKIRAELPPAEIKRKQGNAALLRGDVATAESLYSAAIDSDPGSSALHANRALARLKLGDFKGTEEDCASALRLEPGHVKAFLRRAAARLALGKFSQAEEDYCSVLSIQPQNSDALKGLSRVMALANPESHDWAPGPGRSLFWSVEHDRPSW